MIQVTLNGKTIETEAGISILELAKRQGIKIPTLCHDEELKPYGSCWVCAVEVVGRRGFVTSCGTLISNGMEIKTDTDAIHKARKMALELLISDHYADCVAPCTVACPDHVDIQTYVSLIANGQYHEAVKVIKETLPLPLSIGRVCPAFCEKECRRQLVEEPIAIRQLKRYAADEDLGDVWNYIPEKLPEKGKKIAIIGAGPSGLTCGYYLSNQGYEVKLFEAAPAAGGWLRYGIPEYRLPKATLDAEIALMCSNGMQIDYNVELGKDIFLADLAEEYDAVYLAIGAQKAVPMPVPGSDLKGCLLGVDFLKAHALGHAPDLGERVAIVGGGNTAID
jgi:formate dehydrogenase major subunit